MRIKSSALNLLGVAALVASLSSAILITQTGTASASCRGSDFIGLWRSSDPRLKRVDIYYGGDGCTPYAQAWSRCDHDPGRNCSWGRSMELNYGDTRTFMFTVYGFKWNNADERLHFKLEDTTHIRVTDIVEYHTQADETFTVRMVKSDR